MIIIKKYNNGNAQITIHQDGTRVIEYEDTLELEYPLNVDIRVQKHCSLGLNLKTGKSICSFCHESATTDGLEADYNILLDKLSELPKGVELAIGCNKLTNDLLDFIKKASSKYVINLTINQYHIKSVEDELLNCLNNGWVSGLGISFRSLDYLTRNPTKLINHPNVVWHVISGIDKFEDVFNLSKLGIKKLLVLGEKDFGFNEGKVDYNSKSHKEWYWWIGKLFDKFEVVSFDNLGLETLNIKRFLRNNEWEIFYQGEHSFYINAVDGYLSPSSRNSNKVDWNIIGLKKYFKECQK